MFDFLYRPVYTYLEGDEALLSMLCSYVLMTLSFWVTGLLFLYVDLTGNPAWMIKYKVQEGQNQPTLQVVGCGSETQLQVDKVKLMKVIKVAAINNLGLNLLLTYPTYWLQKVVDCPFHPDQLPDWWSFIKQMVVFITYQEIIFYYSHRLFHHPAVYKRVHKLHHEWTAPIGIVAIYSTPLEYLTGNSMSVMVGPLMMRSHIVMFWFWFTLGSIVTIIHHSGYHLPFMQSPQYHDYHHLKFNWNFGTLGVLDWLHGTDKQFQTTIQAERHHTLFGLTPASVLHPDTDNKKH